MSTRQEELANGRRTGRRIDAPGAIITRTQLRKQRGPIERSSALIILAFGFLGTIVTFAGGWDPLLELRLPLAAFGAGFGVQLFLTILQWWYYDVKALSWTSRLIDAALNFWGYGYIALPWLSGKLDASMDERGAAISAYVILGLLSLAIAWYPESRLVSDKEND